MPDEFQAVWQKTIVNSVSRKNGTQFMTEKLFKLEKE
jgi:hypothetical protein